MTNEETVEVSVSKFPEVGSLLFALDFPNLRGMSSHLEEAKESLAEELGSEFKKVDNRIYDEINLEKGIVKVQEKLKGAQGHLPEKKDYEKIELSLLYQSQEIKGDEFSGNLSDLPGNLPEEAKDVARAVGYCRDSLEEKI